MHIDVGDLVSLRKYGENREKVGIVVNRKTASQGLDSSKHVSHILDNYPKVYYVYFSGGGLSGPLYESELSLQQHVKI